MTGFGLIMQSRRQAMQMSLNVLSGRLGGSPGPSFLSKIETGQVVPTREVATRLADALGMTTEVVLNATGHATDDQEAIALEQLRTMLFEEPPTVQMIPVMDIKGRLTGGRRAKLMRYRTTGRRITDFAGPENAPYVGEVCWDSEREPIDGAGVVVMRDGELHTGTFRTGVRGATWIETGRGEKLSAGFEIMGVILRVTTEVDLS